MVAIHLKEEIKSHKQHITSIEVPENGTAETFFSASRDGKIYEWKNGAKAELQNAIEPKHGKITAIKSDMNRNWLVIGFSSGRVQIHDLNNSETIDLIGHEREVRSIDISYDNKKIATGSCDGKIIIWNTNGENMVELFCPSFVNSIKFIPGAESVITAAYSDGRVRIWDISNKTVTSTFFKQKVSHETEIPQNKFFGMADEPMTSVAVSPDGGLLAFGGRDGKFSIFSFEKDDFMVTMDVNSPITDLAFGIFDPLLCVSTKNSILIFDVLKKNKTTELEFSAEEGVCQTANWARDTLVTGFSSGKINTYSISKQK